MLVVVKNFRKKEISSPTHTNKAITERVRFGESSIIGAMARFHAWNWRTRGNFRLLWIFSQCWGKERVIEEGTTAFSGAELGSSASYQRGKTGAQARFLLLDRG